MTFRAALSSSFLAAMLLGCGTPVAVTPRTLSPLDRASPDVVVAADVRVDLPTGRARTLHAGTRWRAVGTLPEGTVYQPVGTVFIIVGRDVHEASLVLRGKTLHGFFLPGEGNFSSLPLTPTLPLTEGDNR